MRSVIQRVTQARLGVGPRLVSQIQNGIVALVAVQSADEPRDALWTASKLASLRIFRNADKHFDLDVTQVGGEIMIVSNFTVAADARKGRRPSFDQAAAPHQAIPLLDRLVHELRSRGISVCTGEFAADMTISLVNDGPATFILDSANGSVDPT